MSHNNSTRTNALGNCCAAQAERPVVLQVVLTGIPAELRGLKQFGVWRFEPIADEDSGKISWAKIPISARSGRRASSTSPATWSSFQQAARAYNRGGYDGLAFFIRPGGGIVGIDLDKCRDPASRSIDPWARRIVDRLDTYTELSPSGRGLRAFLFGELPPQDRREGHFECYSSARFLTLTGRRLKGAPAAVRRRQDELLEIHTEVFAARVARRNAARPAPKPSAPRGASDLPAAEILNVAFRGRNGEKIRRLYLGDISGYRSRSEADAALCGMLALFCGPDPIRIDELFRGSGLYRDKWDRADYRSRTINLVLSGRSEYYRAGGTPPRTPSRRPPPTTAMGCSSWTRSARRRPMTSAGSSTSWPAA